MNCRKKLHVISLVLMLTICSLVYAQLTGIKYIGGTDPDFQTLESAVDSLSDVGVGAGGVTFLIRDGVYEENDNLTILNVAASEENPVVFRPDEGASVEIDVDIVGDYSAAVMIHNSDYITFDGSAYNSAGTSRDMVINGYRNESDDVFVIWLANGSDHCQIKNMEINSIHPSVNTGWSTPIYCSTYGVAEPEVGMDNFTLKNCLVTGGSTYGVFMDGDPDIELTNFRISGNEIVDWQKFGIYMLTDVHDCEIDGNEIYQTFANARSSVYGVSIHTATSGTQFHHNYIHDLRHSSLAGVRGVFLYGGSNDNSFYNNIISLSPGTTANTSYCFYVSSSGDGENNQIYFNTLFMGGTDSRGTDSYGIQVCREETSHVLKNNIIVNEREGGTGNEHAALYIYSASTFSESDYNFLSVNSGGIPDNRYVARVGDTYYDTLDELLNATGYAPRDQNSLTGDPSLEDDLHLAETSNCIGAGTPITGITDDIDYDPRGDNPDIGADEHYLFSLDPPTGLTVDELGYATWTAPVNDNLIGYNVYLDGSFLEQITETEYQYNELEIDTTYTAGVAALYSEGESVIVTASFTYSPNINTPANLVATIQDFNDVLLTWEAPSTRDLTGYTIFRDSIEIVALDLSILEFLDTDLDAGEYSYSIVANYDEGDSDPAGPAAVTITLPAPSNLLVETSSNDIVVSWGAPGRSLESYNLYRDDVLVAEEITDTTFTEEDMPSGTYVYEVAAIYSGGWAGEMSEPYEIEHDPQGIGDSPSYKTALYGNYPNPFNPTTTIRFSLDKPSNVELSIFNVRGQKVRQLVNDHRLAGEYTAIWNGNDIDGKMAASGIYFFRFVVNGETKSIRKCVLMK